MSRSLLFHELPGESVIMLSGGVYTQEAVFKREGQLYGAKGRGYIRLLDHGQTSHPRTAWIELTMSKNAYHTGTHGRLVLK